MLDMNTLVLSGMRDASHEASQQWFPETANDLGHHALAMCGEVGEVANIVKKFQRGSISLENEHHRDVLASELADVFIYLLNCCAIAKVDLAAEYFKKQEYNEKRFTK